MYPHNRENRSDTVQLLVPEFDSDIDRDNQPTSLNTSQPQHLENNTTHANNPKTKDTEVQQQHSDTDWPDAPTVQIPRVSSTVQDQPPEVYYIRKASAKVINNQEIPDIEEDKQKDDTSYRHLITCHNTLQESKSIQCEYSDKLQDVDNQQYYQQIDQDPQLTYYLPTTPYDEPHVGAT